MITLEVHLGCRHGKSQTARHCPHNTRKHSNIEPGLVNITTRCFNHTIGLRSRTTHFVTNRIINTRTNVQE